MTPDCKRLGINSTDNRIATESCLVGGVHTNTPDNFCPAIDMIMGVMGYSKNQKPAKDFQRWIRSKPVSPNGSPHQDASYGPIFRNLVRGLEIEEIVIVLKTVNRRA
jgi:hypothetical protein